MNKGIFIVFEGGEGSGKTHHTQAFVERLQRTTDQEILLTNEPGGTGSSVGKMIREIILNHTEELVHPRTELLLFLANRAQHVDQVILPALQAGKIVVCDRFSGSTFAYQLGGRQLPNPQFVMDMEEYARSGLTPDCVVYLNVDPKLGLQRRRNATPDELNRLDREELSFHERVREYFIHLAQQDHWLSISTNEGTKQENEEIIFTEVHKRLFSTL